MSTQSVDDSSDEGSGIRRLEKLQRENRRLRETVSFRLGLHLTSAARKAWKKLIDQGWRRTEEVWIKN